MRRALIAVMILLLPVLLLAENDEAEDGIEALLGTIDLSEWDTWFRQNSDADAILPSELLKQFAQMQTPDMIVGSVDGFMARIAPSVKSAAAKTALLLGLAILGASLTGISDTSSIGETAQTVFRIGAAATVLALSVAEIRAAIEAVSATEHTAELLLPPIVGYLTLIGRTNTAFLLPVSFSFLSGTILHLIESCIVPLAVVGGALFVFDTTASGRLASFGKVLIRAAKWILGTACSLYLLVTAIRSAAAGNADTLLLKTTKLAAGSIPTIGSLLSESIDTAFQCMRFVRNALGLTGCAVLLSVAMKPVLSVFLTRSALRVSSLLSEPFSGKPYADLLRGMGDTLHVLMLAELSATAMSLMLLAPVFGMGGGS